MSLLPRRWISAEIKEEGVVGQIEEKWRRLRKRGEKEGSEKDVEMDSILQKANLMKQHLPPVMTLRSSRA